jgi:hypothetical protein
LYRLGYNGALLLCTHYIDAYLAGKGSHPLTHVDRNYEIEANGNLAGSFKDYCRLSDRSREARYDIAEYTREKYIVALARFERIKSHVLQRL